MVILIQKFSIKKYFGFKKESEIRVIFIIIKIELKKGFLNSKRNFIKRNSLFIFKYNR